MRQGRQGDVLLCATSASTDGFEELPADDRIVLAEGEATGHAHVIMDAPHVRHFRRADELQLLVSRQHARGGSVILRHDEHGPIELDLPVYEVRRQREWSAGLMRRVSD